VGDDQDTFVGDDVGALVVVEKDQEFCDLLFQRELAYWERLQARKRTQAANLVPRPPTIQGGWRPGSGV
jgi:hypothetical protein